MKKDNSYIYIVLIKALTGLGRFGRVLSRYDYTHIAVSLEPQLECFLSFSRRSHFTPFDAGFTREYRDSYAFGHHQQFQAKVFKLPVRAAGMAAVRRYVAALEADQDYLFNLYSMVTMPVVHGFPIDKTHNCMTFTARLLELSGTVVLEKQYWKYSIADMDRLLAPYFLYEGYLKKRGVSHPDYMKKTNPGRELVRFLRLNLELCRRMAAAGIHRIREGMK